MPSKSPISKFVLLGKSKYVHVIHSKAYDLKKSECQTVRKYTVAEKIDYKGKGLSAEAASSLDPCVACDAARPIRSAMAANDTPEDRKSKRDDMLEKIADEQKTAGQRKKEAKVKAKRAAVKEPVEPKVKKEGKAKATKSGPRSTGSDSGSKADALAVFAREHGWEANVEDANPGVVVTALRGGETITCFFVDGKYDTTRHASVEVGSWTGKLRGVHGCRKQMAGEGRDRPHPEPGKGRSASRSKAKSKDVDDEVVPEDESPEDAKRRVPFSSDDDAVAIIAAVAGKTIRWRNGQTNTVHQASIPSKSKRTKIVDHPKTHRRMLNFLEVVESDHGHEVLGAERTVYVDKIVRVVG